MYYHYSLLYALKITIVIIFTGVNEFRLGLYDRITGRNVDVTRSKVEWNHSDGYEVGRPSVATISVSTGCPIMCDYVFTLCTGGEVGTGHYRFIYVYRLFTEKCPS